MEEEGGGGEINASICKIGMESLLAGCLLKEKPPSWDACTCTRLSWSTEVAFVKVKIKVKVRGKILKKKNRPSLDEAWCTKLSWSTGEQSRTSQLQCYGPATKTPLDYKHQAEFENIDIAINDSNSITWSIHRIAFIIWNLKSLSYLGCNKDWLILPHNCVRLHIT